MAAAASQRSNKRSTIVWSAESRTDNLIRSAPAWRQEFFGFSIDASLTVDPSRDISLFCLVLRHCISFVYTAGVTIGAMKLAFLAPFVGTASAATIEHWWNVSRALANPDGVRPEPSVANLLSGRC